MPTITATDWSTMLTTFGATEPLHSRIVARKLLLLRGRQAVSDWEVETQEQVLQHTVSVRTSFYGMILH